MAVAGSLDSKAFSWRRMLRALECIALFGGIPAVIAAGAPLPLFLVTGFGLPNLYFVPLLLLAMAVCLVVLVLDKEFNTASLVKPTGIRSRFNTMSVAGASIAAWSIAWWIFYESGPLFPTLREDPLRFGAILLAYAALSAYPQEVVYRGFFFHRYQVLFNRPLSLLLANVVAFTFMHIVFLNWVAIAYGVVAGSLLAYAYHKTKSTMTTGIEHAFYGCLIFSFAM